MSESDSAARVASGPNQSQPVDAITKAVGHSNATVTSRKPQRAIAVLGHGRSVVVVGRNLTLDTWIKTVQEALAKARRAKTYGVELDSFLKMLRDMGQ